MKVKHYIITRFLSNCKMNLGNRVFDKDIIDNGIMLLKTYLLPALEHQSNKNFEWIICIHKDTNKEYLKPLYDIREDFPITFIEVENFNMSSVTKYINKNVTDFDWLITSRVDYDDEFYYGCVDEIQNSINVSKSDLYIYTWKYNYKHYTDSDDYDFYPVPFIKRLGGNSIMLTLVQNVNKAKKYINIHTTGNHTKCANYIKEHYLELTGNDYNNETIFVVNNDIEPKIIYTIHSINDSGRSENDKRYKLIQFDRNKFYNISYTQVAQQ